MIPVSDTVSMDAFCSLFGLTTYEEFCDLNQDFVCDNSADFASDFEVGSDAWQDAFDSASEEVWENLSFAYHKAIKAAMEYLSDTCLISTILNEESGTITFHSEDWNEAMAIVIESINGYGMFYFESGEELILSGPYAGAKEATIAHLHWHKERGNVFGERGIEEVFTLALERALRYM